MRQRWLLILPLLLLSSHLAVAKDLPELHPERFSAPEAQGFAPAQGSEPIAFGSGALDESLPAPGDADYTLVELLDVALRLSPKTHLAWAEARAAAAQWAQARSTYYPSVEGTVEGAIGKIPQVEGGRSYLTSGVGLQYLLLDFGERSAKARAAREALVAANWNHHQAILDLMRDVPQAYHTFLADVALFQAAEKNLDDAQTTLHATEARKASGVSTISDVLQARAQVDQVKFDLAFRRGNREISKGRLATVIGWPANRRFEVASAPERIPMDAMSQDIDTLIEEARASRPDIGAAQAFVRQKEAEMKAQRALPFPKMTGGGLLQWQKIKDSEDAVYYGGVRVQIPVFSGFSMRNALRQAREQLKAAESSLVISEQQVIQEVWDSSHTFTTAEEQYRASQSLLESAQESFDASLARYQAGVADIVELLNAQSTLAAARAQIVNTRMQLFNAYAELLHAVGSELPEAGALISYEQR